MAANKEQAALSSNWKSMKHRISILALISIVVGMLFGQQARPARSAPEAKTCTTYQVPVALAPEQPAAYQVTGSLCSIGDPAGKTVQVLVHGLTLSHIYWDLPYEPERYSYVDALTGAGYATFNLDRIGVGESDHPPALFVTVDSSAHVLHQVIQGLRAGTIGGTPVGKVVLVGHSLGTVISVIEAGQYDDVDGVVATGFLHSTGSISDLTPPPGLSPAQLDPQFSNANLPAGYVTTLEGTRGVFFHPAGTDSQVVALDEATKQTAAGGEIATVAEWFSPLLSQAIHVPVFLVVGKKDKFFCSLLVPCTNASVILQREHQFYSAQGACLEAFVVANSGHNINYHLNAPDFYAAVRDWTDRRVGATSGEPSGPCS